MLTCSPTFIYMADLLPVSIAAILRSHTAADGRRNARHFSTILPPRHDYDFNAGGRE